MIKPYIKGIYDSLSLKEKEIADYIINNSDTVINSTISELAKNVGISDSTVYRFIRKLGFIGYHDFKIKLTQELSSKKKKRNMDKKIPDYAKKIVNKNISLIDESLNLLNYDDLQRVINEIYETERVFFIGVGSSSFVCEYAAKKLNVLGKHSIFYNDTHTMNSLIPTLNSNDLIIVISHTGVTEDVIILTDAIREYSRNIVSITSGIESQLAKQSKIVLTTAYAKDTSKIEFLSSRISEFIVVEIIINGYYEKLERDNPLYLKNLLSKIDAQRLSEKGIR
ncbi:MAG: MurR/RpiR family transcriptional regulator [Thermotogota bacterium]